MDWKDLFPKENRYFEAKNGILYIGEAIETMSRFPEKIFDAIITDPPYGTTNCKWDSIIPFDKMWQELRRIRKERTAIVLFGSEPFTTVLNYSNISEFKYTWIWIKSLKTGYQMANLRPLKQHEIISVFYKKQPTFNPQGIKPYGKINKRGSKGEFLREIKKNKYIQKFTNYPTQILKFKNGGKNFHPTQKPLELMEYLVKTYTNENDLVLDFTAGSGTTLLACERLNRRWIGIEIKEKYCEITKKRLTDPLQHNLVKESD